MVDRDTQTRYVQLVHSDKQISYCYLVSNSPLGSLKTHLMWQSDIRRNGLLIDKRSPSLDIVRSGRPGTEDRSQAFFTVILGLNPSSGISIGIRHINVCAISRRCLLSVIAKGLRLSADSDRK